MSSSGFYISPTGNDNNPGTINAPFLTLAKAQQAMRAVPVADRTAYLLSGTYTVTSPIALNSQDNGETWTTYPGAPADSAVLVNGSSNSKIFDIYDNSSVQNLTFSNLTFDGGSSGGNAIFISGNGNNIHVQNNLFRNHFNGSDLWIYNSDNIYFQDNTSGPNELQPVTGHVTDGKVHSGIFVTDNNISGFSRFGVELQTNSAGYFQNVHLDRNVVNITAGGGSVGNEVFSLVAGPSSVGNTVGGNTITGVRGDNQVFLELGTNNTSVENNSVTQIDHPISFSSTRGSEVENNTFTNDGPAFSPDGGYNDTQWVGVNEVNGVSQTGWSGVPNTTAKPVVWSPSPIPSVASPVPSDPPPTVAITSAGGTVTSATQTISGTVDVADAGSTVTILDGTTKIGTTTVSGTGAWSTAVTLANAGANVLSATDTNAAGTGTSNAVSYTLLSTAQTAPTLSIANSTVHVTAGGSASLGLSVTTPTGATNTTVTLRGLPNYETITDNLDHRTFSGGAGRAVTLNQAEVNSGVTIESFYTGKRDPSATLTITASDTVGGVSETSGAKTITVIDPPASTSTSAAGNPPPVGASNGDLLSDPASWTQTIADFAPPQMGVGDDKFALTNPEWTSFAALLGSENNAGAYFATGATHGEEQQLLGLHVAALAGSKADSKLHE